MKVDKSSIERFIREKVEGEALTDAQIARLLNIGASTVTHWRNKFNIRRADGFVRFVRHFKDKYGPDALEQFDAMAQRRATLQDISKYFGFSREYARQVWNKLYDRSIRSVRNREKARNSSSSSLA